MEKEFSATLSHDEIEYVHDTFRPEDPVLAEIRTRARIEGLPEIHVGRMDGLHLEILTRACQAKKAIEIGTLAGYSGVCIARGLQAGGHLHTLEFEEKHARVATDTFNKAGLAERVTVHQGPALQTLEKLKNQGPFDLVFVDADKVSYPLYLEWAGENLRVGGLLIGDNTLGWGMITQTTFKDPEHQKAIEGFRKFNDRAANSGRFRATMIPTSEGLTVAVKVR